MGDRVLIKKVQEEIKEKMVSGILIPGELKEPKNIAQVIALGNGEKIARLNLSVNDKILFEGYGGEEISEEISNEKGIMILNFDKIIARLYE